MITAKKTSKKAKKRNLKPALKPSVLKKVSENHQLISDIIFATGKSYPTVKRWLALNMEQLTMEACLSEICKTLKLDKSQVLA